MHWKRDDTENTPGELVGKRLYDKNPQNGENWVVAIDYNSNNEETARYGSGYSALGLFCRINDLELSEVTHSMRFGHFVENSTTKGIICKFFTTSSWNGIGSGMKTDAYGGVRPVDEIGYDANEDFYLTFVYRRAKETGETNDKIEYYVNGKKMGYTYYGNDSFEKGRSYWDNDECPFFVGCCPWQANGNVYYLKGNVYSVRLYQKTLTEAEVKANMDATMQYRASF